MATTGLGARITALEAVLGVTTGNRGGVLVLLPGETTQAALARVGAGSWLVVPGVMKDAAAWTAMVQDSTTHK
jgi:hypothetical protein